jgi:hypothetical protein
MKSKCLGSIGGNPHGYVFFMRKGTKICHYCDRPVDPEMDNLKKKLRDQWGRTQCQIK